MPFFVYILQSQLDGSFYIGQTADLPTRVQQHNDGLSKSTKAKAPWKVVYTEQFTTRSDSISRERFLKKQRNRQFYQLLIDTQNL